jgi:Peptidase family M28
MRATNWALIGLLAGGIASAAPPEAQRWWSHVLFLADDRLEGRETGSSGYKKASRYVAARLRNAGVEPLGTSGYFQPVRFSARRIREGKSSAALVREVNLEPLVPGRDFVFGLRAIPAGSVEAPAVFAGYGLSIPGAGHDDFANLDLNGKIAVYLTGAPGSIPGPLAAHAQHHKQRWAALRRAGAVGEIRISNPLHMERSWEKSAAARTMASMSLSGPEFDDSAGEKISLAFNPGSAEKLFAGSGHAFAEIVDAARLGRPLPRFPLTVSLRAKVQVDRWQLESDNVAGVLRGSDPALRNEYVVLTAHLDHLGIGEPVAGDRIYNGAMDNASGVATLLETAQALHESGTRLKRSVIFLAVTGEEKGLLGSEYFAAHPTVSSSAIVADINVDMFLPIFPLRLLTVEGLDESDLGPRLAAVAKTFGVGVQPDPHPERNYFIRSDQYNFILRGIPAIDFGVGSTPGSPEAAAEERWIAEHYHSPSDDTSEPVDFSCAAAYNGIVRALASEIADDPARPHWNATSFFRRFAAGMPSF